MASIKLNFTLPMVGSVEMFVESVREASEAVLSLAELDRELDRMQVRYHGEEADPVGQNPAGDPAQEQHPPEKSPEPVSESGPSKPEKTITLKELRAQLAPLVERDRDGVRELLARFMPEGSAISITNVDESRYQELSAAIEEMK